MNKNTTEWKLEEMQVALDEENEINDDDSVDEPSTSDANV